MLHLRKIDTRVHNLTLAAQRWKEKGVVVTMGYPNLKGKWAKISDIENAWTGWIFLHELIGLTSPELAGMALKENTERFILNWLSSVEWSNCLNISEIGLNGIILTEVIQDGPINNGVMLQLKTNALDIWLQEFNYCVEDEHKDISFFSDIGWPIQFTLGYTEVRFHTLNCIECGDVLFINTINEQIYCFNHSLFPYQWSHDSIMKEEIEEMESETDVEPLYDVSKLPVKVEFVIYHCILKLDEIQKLYKNKIYPFPKGVEDDVEIRVNSSIIGRGQLLQIDERIGIEIKTWLLENQDDK